MDENLTEQEQIENLRKWWDENKMFVLTGLTLGASVLFGWNYYKDQKRIKAYNAAAVHEELLVAVNEGDVDAARTASDLLASDYGSTPYSDLASLSLAKAYVDSGDLAGAAEVLERTINAGGDLGPIARLRLARVRIAQDRAQDALELLSGDGGPYRPLYDEIRGDAHVALGDAQAAHDAYSAALDSDGTAVDRNYVQIKMAALGLGLDDDE
ncbi:MAG: tetratricopeptide repeat protein [Pseudomonadota bacterium]